MITVKTQISLETALAMKQPGAELLLLQGQPLTEIWEKQN